MHQKEKGKYTINSSSHVQALPGHVRELGFHTAKKSMGQNFLKSKEALFKMCEAGGVINTDIVVEIGPGKGALTEKLLEKAGKIIAIEKDRDLIDILKEKFEKELKSGKFILLNEDILGFDPKKQGLTEGGYKIIANIPYNITGSIIRRFLSEVNRPNNMTLLVQYEVAKRICVQALPGHEGKESILSLSVKAYGDPKYIMKVHKRFFSPSPKVDSAIISINNISGKIFKNKNEEESFFTLIKAGFAHKRKVLRKNLEDLKFDNQKTKNGKSISKEIIKEVGLPNIEPDIKNKISEIFKQLNISPKTRAEDVSFDKWIELNNYFTQKL